MRKVVSLLNQLQDGAESLSGFDLAELLMQTGEAAPKPAAPRSLRDRVLDQAACLVRFVPEAMVPDGADRAVVMSDLLHVSQPADDGDGRVLSSDVRQDRLAQMAKDGRLDLTLQTVRDRGLGDAPLDRHFADLLARYEADGLEGTLDGFDPSGTSLPPSDASPEHLRAALQLLAWLPPAPPEAPWLGERRQQIQLGYRQAIAYRESVGRLQDVADGFVGREPLLDWIEDRVLGPGRQGITAPIALHGLGGIGKSAFLARMVTRLIERRPELIVGWIDFDRPGFGTASHEFLTDQLVRQIAAQTGIVAPELLGGTATDKGADLETTLSSSGAAMDRLRDVLQRAGGARPLLIVIDTFEERQRQGARDVSFLSYWIEDLRLRCSDCESFSVIVSGRAEPATNDADFPVAEQRELDDLHVDERLALLEQLGHDPAEADMLAELTGNPLLLHLVSRLVQQEDGPSAAELVGDEGARDGLPPEALQGMIYDRILSHVQDPVARKLAYPGLVLREVTPGIVAEVIAPPVLGRAVDEAEAGTLFEALQREVWLVEDAGVERVRHRADVRRLMMRYLVHDKTVQEAASKIHERAVTLFAREGNERERYYHLAMLGADHPFFRAVAAENINSTQANEWLNHVGADVENLPARVAAILRAAAGLTLSDADIAALPEDMWEETTRTLGPTLVESEDFRRAVAIWGARTTAPPVWVLQALDGLGVWEDWSEQGEPDIDPFHADPVEAMEIRSLNALRRRDWSGACEIASREYSPGFSSGPQGKGSFGESRADLADLGSFLRTTLYGVLSLVQRRDEADLSTARRLFDEIDMALGDQQGILDRGRKDPRKADGTTLQILEDIHRLDRLRDVLPENDGIAERPLGASRFVFVPSPNWLREAHEMAREAHAHLVGWGQISQAFHRGALTLRELTDALPRQAAGLVVKLPESYRASPIFAGTGFPEHRAPLRYALAEAVGRDAARFQEVHDTLVALCKEADLILPRDLGDAFAQMPQTRDRLEFHLAQPLLFADLCRFLPEFAATLSGLWPDAGKLARVSGDLKLWDKAFHRPEAPAADGVLERQH